MARIHELIRELRATSPALADAISKEFDVVSKRRAFGLNFERHTPEAVELPGRPVRRGDKVRILPPRGDVKAKVDDRVWIVDELAADRSSARLAFQAGDSVEYTEVDGIDDLVVVAEFRDPIYPGLVSTGKVERGGDKPHHAVINAENYHALQALLFTHRGKVDAIYIDPPYNTGAKDWKYNNDYVEGDDMYRHSKWLAFMERRLLLAKELLNPEDSVLIVTIDEKEYLRLGMLLEQVFPEARIQMISSAINATGAIRFNEFTRVNEFVYVVQFGSARIYPSLSTGATAVPWNLLQRREMASRRGSLKGGPEQFYPIYVNVESGRIIEVGDPLPVGIDRKRAPDIEGCVAIFPLKPDGTEMNWGLTKPTLQALLARGFVRAVRGRGNSAQQFSIYYLTSGKVRAIDAGEAQITATRPDGSIEAAYVTGRPQMPTTMWINESHNAQSHGTKLLSRMVPDRSFPFPKSLYAVEDVLRFFVSGKEDAAIVDFFSGSGTTAHAVMRLNKQDGGRRHSISITNNEVSAEEQKKLRTAGLRPGDAEWERWGICDHITKPRVEAAISGKTPNGDPIKGDYKFTDEFPMADGFEENVEFFTLTYESAMRVGSHRAFGRIAPLLWLHAGSRGRRIDELPDGWDVADSYGVIDDLDQTDAFVAAMAANPQAKVAFIVTDEDRFFEAVSKALPDDVETVRLYDAYLRTFEIDAMRGER